MNREHQHHTADHGHDHDHGHSHGSSLWARGRHAVSEMVGGHSHDAADQVDEVLEADAEGRRALLICLAGLGVTAAIQAVVVVLSGSVALLGDTLHNVADALTAVPLLVAFRLARRQPSKRFTYGYGRAENLGVVRDRHDQLVGGVGRLPGDRPAHSSADGQPSVGGRRGRGGGFIGNEWVARYRIRVGRRIGSAALVADGLHARTDGFTSLAVLFGAAGVALGWRQADPIIGLVITVAILGVLRSAVPEVGARLMDAVDPQLVEQATAAVTSVEGISEVRDLRIRWIGHTLRAEVDVTVPNDLTVVQAHDLAHHAEQHLLGRVRRVTAATVHASPAGAHGTVPS